MPYFDHNATTPLMPVAREAWLHATEETWHNPSSPYRAAARARARLELEREKLALLVGCAPELIVFTSGATEGANAVLAYWAATLPPATRVAISPTEHPSVLEAARASFGERLLLLSLAPDGVIAPGELAALFTAEPSRPHARVGGVIVMAANNETGVVQPWREIARACQQAGVAYFCDASQWLGKLPAAGLGDVGWFVASAHKFGGPKGTGFVKLALGSEGFRGQRGGGQERNHRGGTEDLPGISSMVAALAQAEQGKVLQEAGCLRWRERFERDLSTALPGLVVVGAGADRLWNTVSLCMPHEENHRWVARLDKVGFQVSTGSACATGRKGPSHVLAAMGVSPAEARRVVRVSSGWETSEVEWLALAEAFIKADVDLRATATPVITP